VVENLWPLGRILEVKPNKRDRLVRRVRLKTKFAVLECPIDKIALLEAARLNIVDLDVLNRLQAVSLLLGSLWGRMQ